MKKKSPKGSPDLTVKPGRNAYRYIRISLKPGETSSLGKVITTKEQADDFMKALKSL